MLKPVFIAATLATFGAASAYAQTTPPSSTTPSPSAPMASPTPGMTLGATDAKKLIGRNVKNMQDETVGEIKSIFLNGTGSVDSVMVGVGGFLGMGEREVRLAWRDLQISDNGETVRVAMTKDQLKALPEYKYPDQAYRGTLFNDSGVWKPDGTNSQAAGSPNATTTPPTAMTPPARDPAAPSTPATRERDRTMTTPAPAAPSQLATTPAARGDFTADGHVSANALIGATVRNPAKEKLGEVDDVYVDQNGAVKTVVVSVGGFLGMGAKKVAMDWKELQLARDGSTVVLTTPWTKESIKSMPAFEARAQ